MRVQRRRQNTKLTRSVSEEAYLSLAILAIFARLCSVPGWVKPTFKHAVCKLAAITSATTSAAAILRANGTGILMSARISPASLFSGVSEGTVGPVVATAASAWPDFELVHPEMIRRIRISIGIMIVAVDAIVEREEFLQKGFLGGGVGIHIGGGSGGILMSTASEEELSGRDMNVAEEEGFGGRRWKKLVVVVGILIRTNTDTAVAHTSNC